MTFDLDFQLRIAPDHSISHTPKKNCRMFTVQTKANPINITTFELDVSLDKAAGSLGVEVYTASGNFDQIFNDAAAWTAVARTKAVTVPGGGGVLIPAPDFITVLMQANE